MRFPVFWLAAVFAAGLAAFADVDDPPRVLFALALAALLLGTLCLGRRWLTTALACALVGFFLFGGATISLRAASIAATRVDRVIAREPLDLSEAVRLTGWLRRSPEQKPFAVFYDLELENLETGGQRYDASGGVRLSYFLPSDREEPRPSLPALRYGDRVEVLTRVHAPVNRQNLGSFDWRAHLARQRIFLEGSLKSPELLTKLPGPRGNRFSRWIQTLRTRLLAQLDSLFPPDTRGDENAVLRAMLLGDSGFLSHRLAEDFRTSGTYHVLVVSGLHVGVIAVFVFWLLRRLRASEEVGAVITLAALVFYLFLVEDRPPIERAVWAAGVYLTARLLFRQVHLGNTTAVAALLVLFLHPEWILDPSFHLSFAAVFLIAFLALPWIERTTQPYRDSLWFLDTPERAEQLREPRLVQFRLDLRALAELLAPLAFWAEEKERAVLRLLAWVVRVGLRALDFFLISLAIHLGFVLLTALYFQRVVWLGLAANILVVPLVGFIVPLGLATLLVALLWLAGGMLLAELVRLLVGLLLVIVESVAGRLTWGIPPPPAWLVVLYLGGLALLAVAAVRQQRQRWAFAGLVALILVVVAHPFPPRLPENVLEATVLDVGQGDSVFLTFPNGETWLVDGGRGPVEIGRGYWVGEDIGRTVVVPYLRARGIKRLDRVWLTHAHHDHMAGLGEVLDQFPVGSFEVGPAPASSAYEKLLQHVRERGIRLRQHRAGERFTLAGVEIEILWPPPTYQPGRAPSNNDSLVLRLCRANTCVLLPGDIETDVEKTLAMQQPALQAAALKVPHHGGRGAATTEFLAAVGPRAAIISVGATNPFGHPFEEVTERLAAQAERVYRTDRDGSVTVRVEEHGLAAESFREQQRSELYPSLWAKLGACARQLLLLESD
ncbi:MAG: ComEC/Rec2 family competence protein [Acidobacteria bacterium]|nr:ComEC/Rec2 family competence protein [Acidobacteriota bacterium]